MRPIGILQGRLGQPTIEEEFSMAEKIGFNCIELLVREGDVDKHPLWTDKGVANLKNLFLKHNVNVYSVCADHFKLGFFSSEDISFQNKGISDLKNLIKRASLLGKVQRILIPFFDVGEIDFSKHLNKVVESLVQCLPVAEAHNIDLAIETTLTASQNLEIIKRCDHPRAKVYYDIGNAASFGFDLKVELSLLGNFISGVHVKDRLRGAHNVPMGQGSVDFKQAFKLLEALPYRGPFILETTPGDNPVEFGKKHFAYTTSTMKEALHG